MLIDTMTTECVETPKCDLGYELIEIEPCTPDVPTVAVLEMDVLDLGVCGQAYDYQYKCWYNKCCYQIEVSNNGDASGVVSKRFLNGQLKETYNIFVGPGEVVDLGQEWIGSACDGGLAHTISLFDNKNIEIGNRILSCNL